MGTDFKDSDDTHWTTSYTDSNGQHNDLCGKNGSSDHCHMWNDHGDTGVVHRGECKVCDDEKSHSDSGDSGK